MVDVGAWRRMVEGVVRSIADDAMQRRAWFGIGPEVSSPDEAFCQFFDDAAIEEFLARGDNGLTEIQVAAGVKLMEMMDKLSRETPKSIRPEDLIDDPRWERIRVAADEFSRLLCFPEGDFL